jgi:SSS family solute:Na+ symporter
MVAGRRSCRIYKGCSAFPNQKKYGNMGFIDTAILIVYGIMIILIGNWLSRSKKSTSSKDFFFADKSLPWYLVGSSIIAANISAEQFIGMSGSGYAIGLGIATYEWIAALILIVVAKYFLPVFIKNEIYTMPQFLAMRFDNRIRTILAVFWLMLFVFVNLSSILYLGALTLQSVYGLSIIYGIIGLAVFSLLYTIVNGLKVWQSQENENT